MRVKAQGKEQTNRSKNKC